jgi:5-methylcytosine-specific restriction endonuclease McrA
MVPRIWNRKLRCPSCAKKRQRQQIEDWYKAHPDKLAEKWRAHKRRRRAAKFGAESERFADREIFERDDWTCGICRHKIDPSVKYPDPRSASLDHIIPLSLGGPHTRSNVRLACLECNVLRGASVD